MLESNDKARELQRQYQREWRARNKDKVRRYNDDYWRRKAEALTSKEGTDKNAST